MPQIKGKQIRDDTIESIDIKDGTILNVDISSAASIAHSKLDISWQESVANYSDLPLTGNSDGDMRMVVNRLELYQWDDANTEWDQASFSGNVANMVREEFTATSSQTVFNLASTYSVGTNNLLVYKNGLLMRIGASEDYLETDNDTITFQYGCTVDDEIICFIGSPLNNYFGEIDTFTATASQTAFDLNFTYNTGNQEIDVFRGGLLMVLGASNDYVETDTDTITFNSGLTIGEVVVVRKARDYTKTSGSINNLSGLDAITEDLIPSGTVDLGSSGSKWTEIWGTDGRFDNVGIGTDSPTAKLEVIGDIISKGTDWTIRTNAADNDWRSVTYGNGLFVAVSLDGTGDRVMTSPDGINWTTRTSAADNDWLGVTYGNGLFVAVAYSGTGNRVMTSPDGINWTIRTSAADNNWFGVTYGNGLFVATAYTGTDDRVMTSPDGINWTIRTSAADSLWYSVVYGNGLFVAVGPNSVMTSPDGINWTIRASATNNNWYSVVYGNGLFVAVAYTGTDNRVMTSPDGISWTSRTSAADNDWVSVTYGNGLFVATSRTGTGDRVMTSPDGINWTIRTSTVDNEWRGLTYGNGMFVAVSTTGTGDRVMTSGKTEINELSHNNIYQGGMSIFGNVGIGTDTVPHGGKGNAIFAIEGAYTSVNGPHIQITTDADDYPLFQHLNWNHDNIYMIFDGYYDGAAGYFKSSDAGSNFAIKKTGDRLSIIYDSDITRGGRVYWNSGIVLDISGNVGIGTDSPGSKLHVYDSTNNVYAKLETGNTNGLSILQFINDARTWSVYLGASDEFNIRDVTGDATPFSIEAGASANSLYISSSGNVGIGTDNPGAAFHVAGTGNTYAIINGATDSVTGIIFRDGSNNRYQIGNVGLSTDFFRIYDYGTAINAFVIKGGDIGIGTDSPSEKLEVNGNIAISDGYELQTDKINITSVNPSDTATIFGDDTTGASTLHIRIGNDADDKIQMESWDGTSSTSLMEIGLDTVTITGNLVVAGTTTTINSETLDISDNTITLNSNVTGAPVLDAFIIAERGSSTDAKIRWNETDDAWQIDNGTGASGNIIYDGYDSFFYLDETNDRVGIGTDSPENDLHIQKVGGTFIKVESSGAGAYGAINLVAPSGSAVLGFFDSAYSSVPEYANNFVVQTVDEKIVLSAYGSNGEIRFYTGGRTASERRMTIDSSGKVGIGTDSPDKALEVQGTEAAAYQSFDILVNNKDTQTNRGTGISFEYGTNGIIGYIRAYNSFATKITPSDFMLFYGSNVHVFENKAGTTQYMTIKPDGNVGIGTTSPSEKLEVNGNIAISDGYELQTDKINITSVNPSDTATIFGDDSTGASTLHIRIGNDADDKIQMESWDGTSSTSLMEIGLDTVTITGNLIVSGTTTTINSETLDISDNTITLNSDVTGSPTLDAFIIAERGSSTDAKIRWNETDDAWQIDNGTGSSGNIIYDGYDSFFYLDEANDRVGIGTDSPAQALDVVGGNIRIENTWPYLSLYSTYWSGNSFIQTAVTTAGGGNGNYMLFYNPSSKGFTFRTAATNNLLTIDTSGNVGIGIEGPDGTLHVHTASAGSVTAHTIANDLVIENSDHAGISILTPTNRSGLIYFGDTNNREGAIQYSHVNNSMSFFTSYTTDGNTTAALTIDSSGYVGIGTAGPSQELEVWKNQNGGTLVQATNTNSGSSARAGFYAVSDVAFLNVQVHSSGRTLELYGIVVAGYAEIHTPVSNGLLIGTGHQADPIIFGTNNLERMRIAGDGNVGIGTTLVFNYTEVGTGVYDANIIVERGASPDVAIRWNETYEMWQYTNDGSTYYSVGANGVDIEPDRLIFNADNTSASESTNSYIINKRVTAAGATGTIQSMDKDTGSTTAGYQECGLSGKTDGTETGLSGQSVSFGTEETHNSGNTQANRVAAITPSSYLVAYYDAGNSNYGTGIIGVVSGDTTITYGSEYVFQNVYAYSPTPIKLTSTKAAIAYANGASSFAVTAVVGTIANDDEIAWGTPVPVPAATTTDIYCARLTDTTFVIAYKDTANSNAGTAVIGSVAGTVITYGTPVTFKTTSGSIQYIEVDALDSTHFVVAFSDSGASNYFETCVGVVSGTVIAFGSVYTFSTNVASYKGLCALSATKFAAAWQDSPGSGDGFSVVATVANDDEVTYGSITSFNGSDMTYEPSMEALSDSIFALSYRDAGSTNDGMTILGNVSGTTISYTSENTFSTSSVYFTNTAVLSINKIVVGYRDMTAGNDGVSCVATVNAGLYYFKVNIDGGGVTEYNISSGAGTTFATVYPAMSTATTGGTWSLTGGDLRCTSGTDGVSSSIALSAGTTGTDLFATLTDFSAFDPAVAGTSTIPHEIVLDTGEGSNWSADDYIEVYDATDPDNNSIYRVESVATDTITLDDTFHGLTASQASAAGYVRQIDHVAIRWDETTDKWQIDNGTGAFGNIIYDGYDSFLYFDETNDRVGIGTAAPTADLDVNGAIVSGQSTITSDTDILDVASVNSVMCDTSSNSITIGGLINGVAGQTVRIVKEHINNNLIIEHQEGVTGSQGINTNDTLDITLATYGGITLVYNGTNWYVVSE